MFWLVRVWYAWDLGATVSNPPPPTYLGNSFAKKVYENAERGTDYIQTQLNIKLYECLPEVKSFLIELLGEIVSLSYGNGRAGGRTCTP